jgi:hypothetical protein
MIQKKKKKKVVDSDMAGKGSRLNSIAAWFADKNARGRIECEQVHSRGGGSSRRRTVEKKSAQRETISNVAL